ncbi:glycosyltransferase family 39 protein [Paenibacillus sp. sgz302251]|uniref:glycosyltransferase family 39 protein n=1 Tax=Paenibacillus sp. sgz302251 TaxID=3414493 RepID=UPI003C7BC80F
MFQLKNVSKPIKIALLVTILLVFAGSTASALVYGDHYLLGSYEKLDNDDVKYVNSAKILLNKNTIAYNSGEEPSTFIMPGMPVVLSGLMLIFGQNDTAVMAFRIFQAALQALSVYFIFVLANQLFNQRTALIAAIATALYLPDYFSAGAILSETMFRTIFILLCCITLLALKSHQLKHYVIAAVLVGLACYFKPHSILLPIVWFLLWLFQRVSLRTIVTRTAIISITLILILSPWWIRNYITFDEFIPFTKSAGNPMLLGALIHHAAPSQAFFEAHPEYEGDSNNLFVGSDNDLADAAKKIVIFGFQERPLEYLKWYTVDKVFGLYATPYYWKTVFDVPKAPVVVYHALLMLMGAAGLVLLFIQAMKKKSIPYFFMLLSLAYFTVIYIPFVAFNRYGYPNVFLIFILAAYAIDWAIKYFERKQTKNAPSL